jgi:hypothetical protein
MANQFTGSPNGGMTVYYIQPSNNQKVTSFPKVQYLSSIGLVEIKLNYVTGFPYDRW